MLKYLSIIIVATLAIKANAQTNDNIQSEVAQNTSEQQGDTIALYMYQHALSVAANAHDSCMLRMHIAQIQADKGNYYNAIFSLESLLNSKNDSTTIGKIYNQIGNIHSKYKNFRLAMKAYSNALPYTTTDINDRVDALCNMGLLFVDNGNTERGKIIFAQADSICAEHKIDYKAKLYLLKSLLYEKNGDIHKALELRKIYETKADSVINTDILNKMIHSSAVEEMYIYPKQILSAKTKEVTHYQTICLIAIFFAITIVIITIVIISNIRKNQYKNDSIANRQAEMITERDKLFGIISHDIITQFNTLLSFSEMQMQVSASISRELNEYSKHIYKSANSLYQLVENVLAWNNIQNDKKISSPETINISQLMENVLPVFQVTSSEKKIAISAVLDETITAYVDHNQLCIIIRNIVSNAIKFTNDGGLIRIMGSIDNGRTIIKIKDNGIGFKTDQLKSILEAKKISDLNQEKANGFGWGLVICNELAIVNKGSITINSEINIGTTVIIDIPTIKP